MRPDSAKFLADIREAGQNVTEITSGKQLSDYLGALLAAGGPES